MTEYRCIVCNGIINQRLIERNLKQNKPIKYCSCKCSAQDPELKERRRLTNLAKYGCESPLQNKQIRDRKTQTMVDRYGEDYGVAIRKKGTQTNMERYGTDVPANLDCKNVQSQV